MRLWQYQFLTLLTGIGCTGDSPHTNDTIDARDSAVLSCDTGTAGLAWEVGYSSSSISILPQQLDATIDWHQSQNPFVVTQPADAQQRDQLFVLLPGSNSSPERGTWMLNVASYAGYHAIGLAFSNEDSISDLCATTGDEGLCHAEIIAERIYGTDSSALVEVDPDNSVIGRLERLLSRLAEEYPGMGWDQFLIEGEVDWSRVVISGASQGGKTATFLSRDIAVDRAVLFNAFGSAFLTDDGEIALADWSVQSRETSPERVYGLWHADESADSYGPLLLEAMSVDDYGTTVDVDDQSHPYGCSHMLRTGLDPGANNDEARETCDPHQSVAADDCVALDDNDEPVLVPVWLHMMTWQEDR